MALKVNWSGLELALAANLSNRTAQQTLRRIQWLNCHGALASQQAFLDFVVAQKRLGKSAAALNKYIQSAVHFCRYMGLTWEMPKHQVEHTREAQTFTDDEITAILALPRNKYTDFLTIIAHSGCRPGEALALSPTDYDPLRKALLLRATKTHENRLIPFDKVIDWEALPFAFTNESANHELERRCKALGIRYRSCYAFRHSFATRLIDNSADVFSVKTLMGHSKLDMTMRYYHSSLKRLQSAIERDTLNLNSMSRDKKFDLLKAHISEMVERLHLNQDKDFEVEKIERDGEVVLRVKKKTQKPPTE